MDGDILTNWHGISHDAARQIIHTLGRQPLEWAKNQTTMCPIVRAGMRCGRLTDHDGPHAANGTGKVYQIWLGERA